MKENVKKVLNLYEDIFVNFFKSFIKIIQYTMENLLANFFKFLGTYECCKRNGVPSYCLGICKEWKKRGRKRTKRTKKGCVPYVDVIEKCAKGENGNY